MAVGGSPLALAGARASGEGKGMEPTASVMAAHQVEVAGEPRWQRRLRLLQALWREEQELPAGVHQRTGDSPPLGSRLAMPEAQQSLHNYLSETIRGVVRAEVEGEQATTLGKVYATPRIYDDLLSSQPLCFNLFAELKAEAGYRLATQVLRHLWPERVDQVSRIEFEHSPGRGDPTYTGTRSAFDVYVEHTTPAGGEGFIGIEVKYHENLQVEPAQNRQRLDEVAEQSGVFFDEHLDELRKPPLQQVWFDHLLALSMLQAGKWESGLFVLLHPVANPACYRVGNRYARALLRADTFQRMTLEEVVAVLQLHSSAEWINAFRHRYLHYERAHISEPNAG